MKLLQTNKYIGSTNFSHGSQGKLGVLLANLGTPEAPTAAALRPYLREFLGDPRVIEIWRPFWLSLLNGIILQTRPRRSARLYKSIWTDKGSPLLEISRQQQAKLQQCFDSQGRSDVVVELGMRYGSPSIAGALERLRQQDVRRVLFLPLYAQYSGTTTASTFDALAQTLTKWRWVPELRTIMQFHDHPAYIEALAASVKEVWQNSGGPSEVLVMSFHGIPTRYFTNGDPYFCHCHKTARLLAEALGLSTGQYRLTFQSQFGKEPWLEPKTDATLEALATSGVRRVDVICPGFTADCLETLEEIDGENREVFLHAGGTEFRYIPALNFRDDFVQMLFGLASKSMGDWLSEQAFSAEHSEHLYRRVRQSNSPL